MTKVLFIGNSFSCDASRYIYGLCRAGGYSIKVVNINIGGCSLYRHYRNMLSEEAAYAFDINGISTGLSISLKKALLMDEWDYISLQQCSPKSGEYDTYQPYLHELVTYIRHLCPPAKLGLHMTWGYPEQSSMYNYVPFDGPADMFPAVFASYQKAFEAEKLDYMIPSGKAIQKLYDQLGSRVYRDALHLSYGLGRYLTGCLWYACLTGNNPVGNTCRDFDEPITEEDIALAQQIALDTVKEAII